MNFPTNRFPAAGVAERALEKCSRLKLDLYKEEDGNVIASFELHGSIGDWADDDDDGGLKEQTDLTLLAELLQRFQQIET